MARARLIGLVRQVGIVGPISTVVDAFSHTRQLAWQRCRGFTSLHPNITILSSLLLAILPLPGSANAANWFVRPSSAGTATGANWNNAWSISGISWSAVSAGDTVWLAGGVYTNGLTVGRSGAAGNPINILRATSTDAAATGAAGWQSLFDSQVQLPDNDGIYISSFSHIVVDGRTQYGILITMPLAGGNNYAIECDPGAGAGTPVTDISFHNIDILGPYASASNPAPSGSQFTGFQISPSDGSLSNVLIDHCRIRGVDMGMHCLITNLTVQYSVLQDFWPAYTGSDTDHPDIMYCYPSPNMIWRYNTIINSESDGLYFEYGGAVNFQFYGNVFYNTIAAFIMLTPASGSVYGPMLIYNNVFMAPSPSNAGAVQFDSSAMNPGSLTYNNIFYNVTNSTIGTSDYNAYNYTQLSGYSYPSNEPHSITFTGNPFVTLPSYSGNNVNTSFGNFQLTAAAAPTFQNGLPLSLNGLLNIDMLGNTRGSPWFIGAYQYTAATNNPSAPTGLRVTSP